MQCNPVGSSLPNLNTYPDTGLRIGSKSLTFLSALNPKEGSPVAVSLAMNLERPLTEDLRDKTHDRHDMLTDQNQGSRDDISQ